MGVDSGFAVDSFTVETSANGEASEVNTDKKSDGQVKKGTKLTFNAPMVIGFSVFAGIAVLIGVGLTLAMVVISANKKKVKSVHRSPPQDFEVDTNFTHHRVDRVVIPGLAKAPFQRPKAAFQDPMDSQSGSKEEQTPVTYEVQCDEFERQVEELFEMFDKNKDGKICAKEMFRFVNKMLGKKDLNLSTQILTKFDTNRNSEITLQEFKQTCHRINTFSSNNVVVMMMKAFRDYKECGCVVDQQNASNIIRIFRKC